MPRVVEVLVPNDTYEFDGVETVIEGVNGELTVEGEYGNAPYKARFKPGAWVGYIDRRERDAEDDDAE